MTKEILEHVLRVTPEQMLARMHETGLGDTELARMMDMRRETIRDIRTGVNGGREFTVRRIREYYIKFLEEEL